MVSGGAFQQLKMGPRSPGGWRVYIRLEAKSLSPNQRFRALQNGVRNRC